MVACSTGEVCATRGAFAEGNKRLVNGSCPKGQTTKPQAIRKHTWITKFNDLAPLFDTSAHIVYRLNSGRKSYIANGGKLGRKKGSVKTTEQKKEEYKEVIHSWSVVTRYATQQSYQALALVQYRE